MTKSLIVALALLMGEAGPHAFAQTPVAARSASPLPVSQDQAAAEKLFESMKRPLPPRRLIGNIYYVGASGVSSFLISTPEGLILIDTTFEDLVPRVCLSIEQLGFRVRDIKFLLSSHAHADHTGGHAAIKRLSGAHVIASAADAHLLATGGADDFSPFPKQMLAYMPVKTDRIVKDGDQVVLGGVTLTAHLTPGHTKGATTWTMTLDEGQKSVVFFSSVTIVEPTRLVKNPDYPNIAEDYAATFAKLKALPCDVFLAPHADQFGLAEKLEQLDRGAKSNPFIDPDGWRKFIKTAESAYLKQLKDEKAGKAR